MQTFTAPISTSYKIECWGARSGNESFFPCYGAYTSGNISFSKDFEVYIYVGERGYSFSTEQRASYNGGGAGTSGFPGDTNNYTGGGATDVRLTSGIWSDFNSLKSRIIVAAGGGGVVHGYGDIPGAAGGLTSNDSRHYCEGFFIAIGASQTSGYKFGIGASSDRTGGGGGYYGGNMTSIFEHTERRDHCAATGGSSFISGYTGCDAISESSTEDNIIHTGQPNHYSSYVFTNPVMIDGGSTMPSPSGGTETGHSGNGYCIITWQQLPQ